MAPRVRDDKNREKYDSFLAIYAKMRNWIDMLDRVRMGWQYIIIMACRQEDHNGKMFLT